MILPSLEVQRSTFDGYRTAIDRELRNTGFEEVLAEEDIDPDNGLIVVGAAPLYSTQRADIFLDLDPMARRIGTQWEVGVQRETYESTSYIGLLICESILGQEPQATGTGKELDYIQLAVFKAIFSKLVDAKNQGKLVSLTKSLRKVDPAGD